MGYANLGQCVQDLEAHGHLRRIDWPIDPYLEMAAIQRRAFKKGAPALLFTRPKGCAFPMLANLFGTKERVRFIFRDSLAALRAIFQGRADPASLLRNPFRTLKILPAAAKARTKRVSSKKAPVLANRCSLQELPKLTSWPGDGGPFITLPLVYSQHPCKKNSGNLGMYRIQLSGNSYTDAEIGLHYQLQRGIGIHHAAALENGISLPVHVYVGGPPALTMAAVMPMPEGMDELVFAGILGGERMKLAYDAQFSLPVLAECDFMIAGHIAPQPKPEGPFGDHLGYYSLRHDFPVLKVDSVFYRNGAIWPFTSVGRPPQEDTVLGDFIHEFTAPLVSTVFPGVREVHAVDASGVHPLLLAIAEERYTPMFRSRPGELLTHAMHLLGTTQTALAKFLLITVASPGLGVRDVSAFLQHMLERSDFANDLHFLTHTTCDTLDYSGTALNEGSKLIWAVNGQKCRSLGNELRDLPDLPQGFSNPRLAAPGIVVLQAPRHDRPRGLTDPQLENELAPCLAAWSARESFPLIVLTEDSAFATEDFANFLWITFTRADPAADIYGANATQTAKHWGCQAPLIIDARKKAFHAPVLEEDASVTAAIEQLAVRGGPLAGII